MKIDDVVTDLRYLFWLYRLLCYARQQKIPTQANRPRDQDRFANWVVGTYTLSHWPYPTQSVTREKPITLSRRLIFRFPSKKNQRHRPETSFRTSMSMDVSFPISSFSVSHDTSPWSTHFRKLSLLKEDQKRFLLIAAARQAFRLHFVPTRIVCWIAHNALSGCLNTRQR